MNRDVAGFVTTRLICALAMEAVALVEAGIVSAEDLDIACQLGFGHAMGPLRTADMTGIDIITNASRNIYADTQDESSLRRSCCNAWSRQVTWDARAARASTTTSSLLRAARRSVPPGTTGINKEVGMTDDSRTKDRPWLMRTYAGHSSAAESNALYRNNLSKGQTGLSVAFDLPTQTGYDPDSELARGEVGKVGCRCRTSATCGDCSRTSRWVR